MEVLKFRVVFIKCGVAAFINEAHSKYRSNAHTEPSHRHEIMINEGNEVLEARERRETRYATNGEEVG
jgi:hypothetical protein